MKSSLLFWGFQDLNFINEVSKKARSSVGIKDFYIQISDSDKTTSLMDTYPEEIIRTKYDLNNLYQWLLRFSKSNLLVIIDLFNIVFQENLEENCISLNKILELKFKFCFIAPKILHPQNLNFINNIELNSIFQNTLEYTKIIKSLYEIIINSGSNSHIIPSPIPENIVLNHINFPLFETKEKYGIMILPKILRKFNASFISLNSFSQKLVEIISSLTTANNEKNQFIFNDIDADYSTQFANSDDNVLLKLRPKISISLERFFKIKRSTIELKFILWLLYLAICEYEVKLEKNVNVPILGDLYFSKNN